MPLVRIDLPSPDEMRGRWAAHAAVLAAAGFARHSFAGPAVWHYDDGGGNWAELALLDQGRALLYGNDHEYSETYYGPAAEYFGEEETDLLADAPEWWGSVVHGRAEGDWVGFVYGFADGVWQQADYETEDGFVSVGLPALSDEATIEELAEYVDADSAQGPVADGIRRLIASGTRLTEAELAALLPAGDLGAGVAAARAFQP